MVINDVRELKRFLDTLPPVDFCCIYGSSLHSNNYDKLKMVDYILGVSNPQQWHAQNLKLNKNHYASWMVHLGEKLITGVADEIGVGVHFNPFVPWNNKMLKYGIVGMHDLVEDLQNWDRFYLCGRLQKPVHILVDTFDVEQLNSVNLRAALSMALLLLPSKFTEKDLYAKICNLSYIGDLRMLFAEDKNKVDKIVSSQFNLFRSMYKPFLDEYKLKGLVQFSSNDKTYISQDCSLSSAGALVSCLPSTVRRKMGMKFGENTRLSESGSLASEVLIGSREEAAKCVQRILRRSVMFSSGRQAISGFLAAGCVNATKYLAKKMCKAWRSCR